MGTVAAEAQTLEALMTPWARELGFDLVRVVLNKVPARGLVLEVLAERPDGTMTIDDCAVLSRALSVKLDEAEPIHRGYTLEVGSPGIERPLVRLADFERFAGAEARVETTLAVGGQRRFRGILRGVVGGAVVLEVGGERMNIAYDDIAKAKLVMSDSLPGRAGAGGRPGPSARPGRTKQRSG